MKSPGRALIRIAVVAGVVGGAVAVASTPAFAADSDLDVSGTTIYYTADAGVTNNLTVTRSGDTYLFVESGGDPIVSSDPACSYPVPRDTNRMQCVVEKLEAISINVGDLSDTVTNKTDRAVYIYGGSGNDTIIIGGKAGITSYAYGGSGDDKITSGPGNDVISGSTGTDTVSFPGPTPVTASLITNTAIRAGDTDTLSGIENLTGGYGSDTLIGSNGNNVLDGGSSLLCTSPPLSCAMVSGDDTMFGLGGADTMYGRGGNDWMWGGDADDTMYGHEGDDHLFGDAHVIYNSLLGGPGNDQCEDGEELECEY